MHAHAMSGCSASCSSPLRRDRAALPARHSLPLAVPLRSRFAACRTRAAASTDAPAQPSKPRAAEAGGWRQRLAGAAVAATVSACITISPAAAAEPFLSSTGARGLLAEEEAELFRLRKDAEREVRGCAVRPQHILVREELNRARVDLEAEGRSSQVGKLCATPFGVDIVGITELVALVGALVGGVTARQRKNEVERLNEQLRKINTSLRKQARSGTIYAPGLTYVPPGAGGVLTPPGGQDTGGSAAAAAATAQATATAAPAGFINGAASDVTSPESPATLKRAASLASMSMDEEESAEAKQCLTALREGKRLLKSGAGAKALVHFEKALMLAKFLGNKVQERRAVRGLAAASRLQGQHPSAITHLQRVLEISNEMGDHVGDADAYGTIADIYTDMGDFDAAAKYYDKYIEAMNTDGPV